MKNYSVAIQYSFGSCVYVSYKASNETELNQKIAKDDARLLLIKSVS
jgi:hypothetical protein